MDLFHEGALPLHLDRGGTAGVERRTEIVPLASGREARNGRWAHGRRRYDLAGAVTTLDDLHTVIAFFEARRGRLQGFRFRDDADCKSCPPGAEPSPSDQVLGGGDDARTAFPLVRVYGEGPDAYVRTIAKPVAGSVRVAVAGVEIAPAAFALDARTGVITLATPAPAGALVTAGFVFDTPVRFDADCLELRYDGFGAGRFGSVPLVEVLV